MNIIISAHVYTSEPLSLLFGKKYKLNALKGCFLKNRLKIPINFFYYIDMKIRLPAIKRQLLKPNLEIYNEACRKKCLGQRGFGDIQGVIQNAIFLISHRETFKNKNC